MATNQPKPAQAKPTAITGQEEIILKQREALHLLHSECMACQEEVEPNWQFCAHCGVRLATQCPGCGNPLPPAGAPSCPTCGLAIPQVKAAQPT